MKNQSDNHIRKNQVHPPLPKKKRVDVNGNDTRRMWLRDGKTTMPFVEGLTQNACSMLINSINTTLISLGGKPIDKKRFLITK